jgi:type II secretory pathway pseudopilin PulG
MKTRSEGYTILEALIFLAVSGILFAVIYPTFIGRDNTEKFSQSVRDLESKINDTANDVSTGYFPASANRCSVNGSGRIVITGSGSEQGTNVDCIFLGKALRFNNDTDKPAMDIITVVGKKTDDGAAIATIAGSDPTAVTPAAGYGFITDITEEYETKWRVAFTKTGYINGGGSVIPTAGFSFLLKLDGSGSTSDTKNVDIYNLEGTTFGDDRATTATEINSDSNTWSEKGKFIICMTSPYNNNQKAAILISNTSANIAKALFDDNIDTETGVVCD